MDLTEAMKLLTAPERAAIILCCQNGLSHEEAAQALECPLGTVKTNILRGKEKLRRRLAFSYQNYEPA
jgi:RNA polymerase sigma-70 factor (ECF subfamily)